jgi:DNA-binding XRE family transcriptional regulator
MMPKRTETSIALGKALRYHRERASLSQAALGKRLHAHPTRIAHTEAGGYTVSEEYITQFIALEELQLSAEDKEKILSLYAAYCRGRQGVPPGVATDESYENTPHSQSDEEIPFSRQSPLLWVLAGLGITLLLLASAILWRGRSEFPTVQPLLLQDYCQDQGFQGAVLIGDEPYGWECYRDEVTEVVDLSGVCRTLYADVAPYALLSDTANPYSWVCQSTSIMDYENGWCGAVPVFIEYDTERDPSFYPRLYFDREINPAALLRGPAYLYFEGEYQEGGHVRRRGSTPSGLGWQFDVDGRWANDPANARWTEPSAWRFDFKCP